MYLFRYVLIFVFAEILLFQANAQTYLGFTNGNVERKKGVRFGTQEKQGMAMYISAEKSQALKGTSISGLRAAFGTSILSDMMIFVTKDLNGEKLVNIETSGAATKFKEFTFDTPFIVDGDPFYVGITFSVSTSYKPILFDLSNDFSGELFYALSDGKWVDVTNKGYGALNLQLVCDDAPQFSDLMVKPVSIDGYIKTGDKRELSGQLFNFGTVVAKDYSLSYRIGDNHPIVFPYSGETIAPGSTKDFVLSDVVMTGNGRQNIFLQANFDNSNVEVSESDNQAATSVFIYPEWIKKRVLIESFTGQTCSNCPAAHEVLDKVMSQNAEEFVVVAHHSGYAPDAFSMQEDWDYTWFYNSNKMYAPAVTFDRTPYSDGLASVVFLGNDAELVNNAVETFKGKEPFVSIKLNNLLDVKTRKGELEVSVYTCVDPSDAEHRLNLFLVQDNMVATQAGKGSTYVHSHVFRGTLNGTWGEIIDLVEGETLTKTYQYEIPEKIMSSYENRVAWDAVLKDMSIVAFVSDASTSAMECFVWNTETTPLLQSTDRIGDIQLSDALKIYIEGHKLSLSAGCKVAYVFTPSGQVVNTLHSGQSCALPKGTYIVKIYGYNGNVAVKKIIL